MKLLTEKSLVLVVDIQERLIPAMDPQFVSSVQKNAAILIQGAEALGVPVFVTEQYPRGLGSTVAGLRTLLPASARIFEKTAFSCAKADGFLDAVKGMDRSQVVLCGMESHVCVYQTARDLRAMGFDVVVAQDAVCSRTADNRAIGLSMMASEGALLSCTESVLFDLLGAAGGDRFKAISALVK